jgi:transposase
VDHYELIRRMHFVDGLSGREIAKRLGHARKTVRKALTHAAPPPHKGLGQTREKPSLGPLIPIIDAWLEQDLTRPRKQRHTGERIYERLRDEHGYTGHPSTVRRYVGQAKAGRVTNEVFMPLEFGPGEEAQVDWGEAAIIENGRQRTIQLFCMRLCFSKRSFVYAYERQNMESFLDGHVRAFAFFGGVTRRLAYDNLKCAVIHVGRGRERRLNRKFVELRSWYLFQSRFCNVARGNEKGHVENLVKRSQRTFLTPLPEVIGLGELNEQLQQRCRENMPDADLWQQDQQALLPLAPQVYPACYDHSTIVDKHSLVHIDNHSYSVPVAWAHQPCLVRLYVDRVEVYCRHELVAAHARSFRQDPFVLEPLHYVPLLERKPGCLDQARAFKREPWGEDFTLLRRELEYRYAEDGTRQFIRVLLLLQDHGEADVKAAVRYCVARRAFSEQAVLHALQDHPVVPPPKRLDLFTRPDLQEVGDGVRSVSIYDQLLESGDP